MVILELLKTNYSLKNGLNMIYLKVNNTKYKLDNLTIKQFKELISSLDLSNKEISFKRLTK